MYILGHYHVEEKLKNVKNITHVEEKYVKRVFTEAFMSKIIARRMSIISLDATSFINYFTP
jgi:hypothetical protein